MRYFKRIKPSLGQSELEKGKVYRADFKLQSGNNISTDVMNFPDNWVQVSIKDYVLPKYWRVKSYEKSYDWAWEHTQETSIVFGFIFNQSFGTPDELEEVLHACDILETIPEISQEEFEYHVHTPWEKQRKEKIKNEPRFAFKAIELEDHQIYYVEDKHERKVLCHLLPVNGKEYCKELGNKIADLLNQ